MNGRLKSVGARLRSRWDRIEHRIGGFLLRISPEAFIRLRWPWPVKKPFQHSSLVLSAMGGGFGDELMCLPIFEEIKKRNPACRITFATRRPEFFKGHPAIDELIEQGSDPRGIQLGYHYIVPPHRSLISHMAECIGIIGRFEKINPPPLKPSGEIVAELGGLRPPIIVVQPFSSGWTTNKNWPLESWRTLIRELVKEGTVVEVGTEPAFPPETFGLRFVSMAGRSSLHDLAYIISRAQLFIGPSSSGMHLANAYQVPSVIIFGGYESPVGYDYPLAAALYTPVECAPCWRQSCPYELKCLRAIDPERVLSEARKALKGSPPGTSP